MISYIKKNGYAISEESINTIEMKYGFQFPLVLRKFYLSQNGAMIYPQDFRVAETEYTIVRFIYPYERNDKSITISALLEMEKKRKWLGDHRVPFASDWGDDIYCWDVNTGEVFLHFPDDSEPILVADNIDVIFDCLAKS